MDAQQVTAIGTDRRTPARAVMAVALAVVLALSAAPGASAPGSAAPPGADARTWIVDVGSALPALAEVVGALPVADALIVTSPVAIPGAAPWDAPLRPESLLTDVGPDGLQLDSGVATTGAPAVWADGERGRQAVVALIDTGVADVPALHGAMAGEIDFSGTGGGDGYGHGTFLASLIANRSTTAPGVAPEAGILSLKVADGSGEATLGAVMSALQWLHGPGRAAGIRVASLALAIPAGSEGADVLERGVERVTRAGLLVATAAGNDGPALTSPATTPGAFGVGATDDAGTADRGDDVVADFSGLGGDVLAPGVSVVGSLPEGSVIESTATPVAEGLYSGSGTSMATALTAGVAALASSARPDLDGAALGAALGTGTSGLGAPYVDAPAALDAALAQPARPGNGEGPGNGAGNGEGIGSGNGNGQGPGSADPASVRWGSVRWGSVRWGGAGWGDASWTMQGWGSVRWAGGHWSYDGPVDPQSVRWASVRWASVRWAWVR